MSVREVMSKPAGQVIGVVSESDVIREMVVPDIMSTHTITVSGETDLAVATELMTSPASRVSRS